jgi:hypothetical protein
MTSFYNDKTKPVCLVFKDREKNFKLAEVGAIQGSLIITSITCSSEELVKLGVVQRLIDYKKCFIS